MNCAKSQKEWLEFNVLAVLTWYNFYYFTLSKISLKKFTNSARLRHWENDGFEQDKWGSSTCAELHVVS